MSDLLFDTQTRDLVIKNGDLVFTSNPSVQNGVIIKDARCINVYSPILGVGFNPIGAQASQLVSELNRWKKQAKQDGAKNADFNLTQSGQPMSNANIDITTIY